MIRSLIAIIVMTLTSCATNRIQSWGSGELTGTYLTPRGWQKVKIDGPARTQHMIQRIGRSSRFDPAITIDAFSRFDPRFPSTQDGCAESYLEGIHDVDDDSVQYEKVGSVENPHSGVINIYRYHSEWLGDHLVSMIVYPAGFVTVELWTKTREERQTHTEAFMKIVEEIQFNESNKTP